MFIYKQWDEFCKKLYNEGFISQTASDLKKNNSDKPFLVLKHDVETNPSKALKLAQIENKYSHKGSYYVQAYLLKRKKHIKTLKKIQELGHEVSYHHDVMDGNKGDIVKAKAEFQRNVDIFQGNGFAIETVCQHGNPVIERNGYYSNRDFFRDNEVAELYHNIDEIMVNFRSRINHNYKYISDAGYGWKIIFDPENNDRIKSSEKDVPLDNLDKVMKIIRTQNSVIISTHPHRWNSSKLNAKFKNIIFKNIKFTAKIMLKMPLMKKIMGRFYYLAKKI
ncbi:hypothetical protein [Bacillus sp. Marseille-P3661]|uniref:hypothetical protein n=1 Tax=Bacillus sp. Marseille-P3661 TaxID=1936234 RepID=UPI000C8186BB|nr:hypothetical protein [Bacillus sp. Marseille-P3661]